MAGNWQEVIVTAAAVAAIAWLVVGRLRRRREKSKCDSCGLAQALRRDD